MKLDSEQVLCHSTISCNSDLKPYSFAADTKPFENKEKPPDSTGLNAEGIVKENQNGVMHDKKGNDGDSDFSLYRENTRDEWTVSKIDSSMSVHDFANGNEKKAIDCVTSNSHSSENQDPFQDSVFYLDKSVMECELPELVVCSRESTCHVVKDVCIDEGVPRRDKFLVDSGLDVKSDLNFPPSEKDQDSKLMKEKLEIDMPMQDVLLSLEENQSGNDDHECGSNKKLDSGTFMQDVSLSLEENESNKGIPNQCNFNDLMLTKKMKQDAMKTSTDDVSKELFTLEEILPLPELSILKSEAVSSDCRTDGIEKQSFQNSSKKEVMVMSPFVSAVEKSNNLSEEAILSAPALASAAEESDCGKEEATTISPAQAPAPTESTGSYLVNEVSNDGKLETGSIAFDFGSSASTSSKDDCRGNILDHEPLETGSTPKLEDTADQPSSNNPQHGNGESSFSAAGPVTGLITCSGPIAYSGNLSLRSDSSTTSTRSFAFPILQPEWNSSPARMAKADRRHYRKHRSWRHHLLCCRF